MSRLAILLFTLVVVAPVFSAARVDFNPPDAILQAGRPLGFRAFIPDFPGCELFTFHGKLNSPFEGDEVGAFFKEILQPHDGFWTFQDLNTILTPGDVLHYWTNIMKDKIPYLKKNLTWTVPDADESVDLLTPVTSRPPRPRPTPEKMRDTEPTTPSEEPTTEASTSDKSAKSTPKPSQDTKEEAKKNSENKPEAQKEETKKPSKMAPPPFNPLMSEDVEELTTPSLLDKPLTPEEFPLGPSPLFPFAPLFPTPFKPPMPQFGPGPGPGFDLCSNPWNFEEQLGDTRAQKLEKQVAKLQCQLGFFQRGYNQLGSTVENELNDLKKIVTGLAGRMSRLENLLRNAAFG